jgi:predicted nucleic acid-binding protein
MILVDTSAWIAFFRGRDPLASLVERSISDNDAAICGPVEAELRRDLASGRERKKVLPLLSALHILEQPDGLWMEAGDLGYTLRRRGVTAKTMDLIIATYALAHSAELLTADTDFLAMQKAGVPLRLVRR